MHEPVSLLLSSGRIIMLRIATADTETHAFFSQYPDTWQRLVSEVRDAALRTGEEARNPPLARGDGTGEP